LLDASEVAFDAFVTMDQNLRYQQNLKDRGLRIIVLRAPRNSLAFLAPLAPAVLVALAEMPPGELRILSV
jgi:hypothetical protein